MEMPRLAVDPAENVHEAAAPIDYLFGPPEPEPAAPPELTQQEIRYERGSTIYALDGPVGALRQVVIDEDLAEVKALVVRVPAKNEPILVPPELVDRSVGTALFLNVSKEQFALGASRSPRFNARMFSGADTRTVARVIPLAFRGSKQRSVVDVTRDCLVTAEVLDLPRQRSSLVRPSRWKFFARERVLAER